MLILALVHNILLFGDNRTLEQLQLSSGPLTKLFQLCKISININVSQISLAARVIEKLGVAELLIGSLPTLST